MKIAYLMEGINDLSNQVLSDEQKNKYSISLQYFKNALNENIKADYGIYKGISGGEFHAMTWGELTPIPNRMPAHASSMLYHNMFRVHPTWKSFADRNVIATTSYKTAIGYGRPFALLPSNGTKIYVLPEGDLWYSFRQSTAKYFNGINEHLDDIMMSVEYMAEEIFNIDLNGSKNIIGDIKKIDTMIAQDKNSDTDDDDIYSQMKEFASRREIDLTHVYNYGLLTTLYKFFDIDVEIYELEEYFNKLGGDATSREVWFDSDYLVVSMDDLPVASFSSD